MYAFNEGDLVTANVTAQGLTKGTTYKVIHVVADATPYGTFVDYLLTDTNAEAGTFIWRIRNGHMILSKATA